MKQIYDFEVAAPPILNERILREKAKKRETHRLTLILPVSVVLFQVALLLFGIMTFDVYPVVMLVSLCHIILSAAGSGAIAVIYVQKGGKIYE